MNELKQHFEFFGFVHMQQLILKKHFDALAEDYRRTISSQDLRLPFNELGQAPAFVASCMSEVSPTVIDFATSEDALYLAEAMLGRPAVCVNAFAYQRSEDTRWHSDNTSASYHGMKFYLNLDSVDADSGALRVIVGSHNDPLFSKLLPDRYQTAEERFGMKAEQLPAEVLVSRPGDLNLFDLRVWHAVCGTQSNRRVIELTYYQIPETAVERAGFVTQMLAHQRQARLSGTIYYPISWLCAGGPQHRRGLEVLAQLDLLETCAGMKEL